MLLRDYLGSWGMVPVVAATAEEGLAALDHAEGPAFQAILVGLALDSEDLGRLLAGLEQRQARFPRLLLADLDEQGLSERVKALGFNAWLTKPVHQSRLFDTLAELMDRAAASTTEPEPKPKSVVEPVAATVVDQTITAASQSLILLAEDNPINRKLALGQLRKLGYTAEVAENGQIAVDKALAHYYPLILMDIQMPVMDGITAMQRIRAAQAASERRSAIVAVTANAMEGDRERFLAEGMDDYQSKPYGIEQLRGLLHKWLENPAS